MFGELQGMMPDERRLFLSREFDRITKEMGLLEQMTQDEKVDWLSDAAFSLEEMTKEAGASITYSFASHDHAMTFADILEMNYQGERDERR